MEKKFSAFALPMLSDLHQNCQRGRLKQKFTYPLTSRRTRLPNSINVQKQWHIRMSVAAVVFGVNRSGGVSLNGVTTTR